MGMRPDPHCDKSDEVVPSRRSCACGHVLRATATLLACERRRPGQHRTSFRGTRKSMLHRPRQSARVGLRPGRRGCAGHSAGPATHSRAHCGAGRAPDRKRYDTPDRRADTGARRSAGDGARAGIGAPTSIPVVISGPINRVRTIAVIGDRRGFPVGIHPARPPAIAILIAGNIGTFDRLGASCRGDHQGCARDS